MNDDVERFEGTNVTREVFDEVAASTDARRVEYRGVGHVLVPLLVIALSTRATTAASASLFAIFGAFFGLIQVEFVVVIIAPALGRMVVLERRLLGRRRYRELPLGMVAYAAFGSAGSGRKRRTFVELVSIGGQSYRLTSGGPARHWRREALIDGVNRAVAEARERMPDPFAHALANQRPKALTDREQLDAARQRALEKASSDQQAFYDVAAATDATLIDASTLGPWRLWALVGTISLVLATIAWRFDPTFFSVVYVALAVGSLFIVGTWRSVSVAISKQLDRVAIVRNGPLINKRVFLLELKSLERCEQRLDPPFTELLGAVGPLPLIEGEQPHFVAAVNQALR